MPLTTCTISVRISDINYGGHVGNDSILTILHEARLQWLQSRGMSELNADGTSMIMGDVMIAYKGESFYGDKLQVDIWSDEVSERSFDLLYRVKTMRGDTPVEIAHAKTGMIAFDYEERKVVKLGEGLKKKLQNND